MRFKTSDLKIRFRTETVSLLAAVMLLTLGSCDAVHQFPEVKDEPEPDPVPEETVTVPISLVYSPDFYVWEYDYDPMSGKIKESYPDADIFPAFPGTTSTYDNTLESGVMDVHVKAYLNSATGKLVKEETFSFELQGNSYDTSMLIELPVDTRYTLAVWSHLREHTDAGAYYDPTDFNKVGIVGTNYAGNTDYRDGFSGTIELDTYAEADRPYEVPMTRPMGKFEFLTIDLSEFLDRETTRRTLSTRATADEYIVVVSFPFYFPSSYSVLEDRLENSLAGVSFRTRMSVTGVSEASLGFEYVLLNDITDGGIQTRVDIYDPDNEHVAGSTTLTIPMRRDHHTVLRGAFLSEQSEGGVGIDPDFEGDFNVTM